MTSSSDKTSDAPEPSGSDEAPAGAGPDEPAAEAPDGSSSATATSNSLKAPPGPQDDDQGDAAPEPAADAAAAPAPAAEAPSAPQAAATPREVPFLRRFFLMEQRLKAAEAETFQQTHPGFADFDLARRALEGVDTLLEVADRQDGALLLLRDAAMLGVRARVARTAPERAGEIEAADAAQLWTEFEGLEAAQKPLGELDEADRAKVEFAVVDGGGVRFAQLSKDERQQHVRALRKFVPPLVDALRSEANRAAEIRVMRRLRIGAVALVVVLLIVGIVYGIRSLTKENLALGKPVKLSSYYKKDKFPPEALVDGNPETLGGHTRPQDKPWAQIDLQQTNSVREIVVTNRLDEFQRFGKRATPLLIEVSTDGHKYQEFARRNDVFTVWTATPTKGGSMQARFIRLTALKKTELHLAEVAVY